MARLIVNADDYGYTSGINRAVEELHHSRALTSTSLMANGSALEDALGRLRLRGAGQQTRADALGTGCHVVLVDGAPVLPGDAIPTLAPAGREPGLPTTRASRSRFRASLGAFVADLLRGRIEETEIERETIAQIRCLQARGVHVTHLDSHKHTHMFPRVLRPMLRAALQCGVRAIRNPFEPSWSRAATLGAPLVRRAEVRLLASLQPEFARLVAAAGLATTDGAIGVLATGTLNEQSLAALLQAAQRVPAPANREAIWELVCHPGYHNPELAAQSTRLQAARETERAALLKVLPAINGVQLIHFGQLSDQRKP